MKQFKFVYASDSWFSVTVEADNVEEAEKIMEEIEQDEELFHSKLTQESHSNDLELQYVEVEGKIID